MNKELMRAFGFGKEVERAERGECAFCGERVRMEEFKDEISLKEFSISSLCQDCQDEVFKEV